MSNTLKIRNAKNSQIIPGFIKGRGIHAIHIPTNSSHTKLLDKKHGAFYVMIDDVLAGFFAALVLIFLSVIFI